MLTRGTPYLTLEKKKNVMNSFFNAQFNYCPFIWMFHSRKNNNKIKHLHERCLLLIYNNKKSSYENLVEKDNSVSIHHKNIQALAIEMFKVKHKLYPETTGDIFIERTSNQHNLRNHPDFITPHVHTVECLADVPPFFVDLFLPRTFLFQTSCPRLLIIGESFQPRKTF